MTAADDEFVHRVEFFIKLMIAVNAMSRRHGVKANKIQSTTTIMDPAREKAQRAKIEEARIRDKCDLQPDAVYNPHPCCRNAASVSFNCKQRHPGILVLSLSLIVAHPDILLMPVHEPLQHGQLPEVRKSLLLCGQACCIVLWIHYREGLQRRQEKEMRKYTRVPARSAAGGGLSAAYLEAADEDAEEEEEDDGLTASEPARQLLARPRRDARDEVGS